MATRLPKRSQLPLAVLALLTERPMGHRELIGELPRLLGPRHRSLPHGVDPVLEALEDEGLIEGEADGAPRTYHATPAGDAALQDRAEAQILDHAWRDERPRGWVGRRGMRKPGTVTVLFTDLVESTALFDGLGDEAAHELRRRHFALLRKAIGDHHGSEVKSLGDGLMVVFSSAASAVACAVAMQRATQCCGEPVGLRIGIEAGEPVREGADFFGRPVIVAKRLCDAARSGQIIASELVRGPVGSGDAHVFEPLGSLELKGLSDLVAATTLCYAPTPSITLTSLGGARHPAESRPRVGELLARGLPQPVTG